MIKFFRKIRQRLIAENKVSKYLLYAIGEIILVVIGILIALQINNNNEFKKEREQEQNYLKSLKEEFTYNKNQLKDVIDRTERYGNAAQEILENTGPIPTGITDKEFSRLYVNMVNTEIQYRPSNGVLDEIINSGKLEIFQNHELKRLLSSWSGIMVKVRFQEQELGLIRLSLIDLGQEHANLRNMVYNSYESFNYVKPSRFQTNNLNLLKLQEFENETMAYLATTRYANMHYYPDLLVTIESILDNIDHEIE